MKPANTLPRRKARPAAPAAPPPPLPPLNISARHDLCHFGLSDMIEAGRAIRAIAAEAGSMESAAGLLVRYFYQVLANPATGEKNCALVRCFKTHRLNQLPTDLASQVGDASTGFLPKFVDIPCLTLLATAGDDPAWNDRRTSAGHAVIPLTSLAMVERAPMISRLIAQMGLEIADVMYPSEELLLESDQRSYNVFHIENAVGSPFIPAQQDFVLRHGIKSVLGFGGLLPSGDLFSMIMFCNVTIPRETAALFKTLALSVKLVLLPFTRGPVFANDPPARANARGVALRLQEQEQMRSEVATLRLLIPSLEDAAIHQTNLLQRVISDLHHQGKAFQQLGERLSAMLESTTDSVFLLDREWRFTYLNQHAQALLSAAGSLQGENIWEVFPAAVGSDFWHNYHAAMDNGETVRFQEHFPAPLDRWFDVHAFPSNPGIAVFFHDITDRRNAERALIENEKLAVTGRLAASIAHEINNPLEAITNLLYLLETDLTLSGDSHTYLKSAQHELQRVSEIATQTLRFYRQSTNASRTSVEEIVDSVLALYSGRLTQASVEVTRRIRPVPLLETYSGELRQVIANLVANAIDALPGGGRILARIRPATHPRTGVPGMRITVADSGLGMSPATRARLFEAFFTTKGATGTGLGLWVSQELVRKNSGEITVRSSQLAVAHGTVFALFFPLAARSGPLA